MLTEVTHNTLALGLGLKIIRYRVLKGWGLLSIPFKAWLLGLGFGLWGLTGPLSFEFRGLSEPSSKQDVCCNMVHNTGGGPPTPSPNKNTESVLLLGRMFFPTVTF